jgi:hypothetical protein
VRVGIAIGLMPKTLIFGLNIKLNNIKKMLTFYLKLFGAFALQFMIARAILRRLIH